MNKFIENIQPSASAELMKKVQEMKANGEDIIGLAGGEPDFDTPDRIRLAAIEELCKGNTHYAVGTGLPELRARIARKFQEENSIDCDASQIVVAPGGKYAIYLAIAALLNPGEKVMILDPSWVSYAPIVQACQGIPVHVGLTYDQDYQVTTEVLEAAYSSDVKLLIINYPNNPTGCILSQQEAEVIKDFIVKHNLYLLSDEIYEKIIYDGQSFISPGSFPEIKDQVITVNGFSKAVAMTGWRLGYMCVPKALLKNISTLYSHTITGTSPFLQKAAIVALDCTEEMEAMRKIYEERRNYFISALNAIPGVSAKMPKGAFYAFVHFEKDHMNSFQMADYLLHHAKVVGVPGDAYGKGGDQCIRFSFANSIEDLKEAVTRIANVM